MMKEINPRAQEHADIRQAIRDLCSDFDSEYWQKVEEESGYPEEFVRTLTQAGWLSVLIP
jgi:acyl-CoA dehydrogenase